MIVSKNVWMYSTIGLAAILALGFSFPQAFAADKTHQEIIAILSNGISNILNAITGAKNDINTNTNNGISSLQAELETTTVVTTEEHLNPEQFQTEEFVIAQASPGKVLTGHTSLMMVSDVDNIVNVQCDIGILGTIVLVPDEGPGPQKVNQDFNCYRLFVSVTDNDTINDEGTVISAITTYQELDIDTSQ